MSLNTPWAEYSSIRFKHVLRYAGAMAGFWCMLVLVLSSVRHPLSTGDVISSFALFPETQQLFTFGLITASVFLGLWAVWLWTRFRSLAPAWVFTLLFLCFLSLIGIAAVPTPGSGIGLQRIVHWGFSALFMFGSMASLSLLYHFVYKDGRLAWVVANIAWIAVAGSVVLGYVFDPLASELWAIWWLVLMITICTFHNTTA